jgi:uncharacterized protein YndB with AHSA1/START domain/DNA gyrase inhibitor GyrI
MRVAIIIVLVLGALFGGLYGVGHFLLPNTLQVSATVAVERPRAMVFALVSHVRQIEEWSPYRQMDPEMEAMFSGEDGQVGQSMRWRSAKRNVGNGSLTVLEMTANERVAGRLELDGRARLETAFIVSPADAGSQVTWEVSGACDPGLVNIPCRYANLLLAGAIRGDLEDGLANLKRTAEGLPDVDFEGVEVEVVNLPPRRYIFDNIQITATAARSEPDQVAQAMGNAERTVAAFFTEHQLLPDSPSRVVVTTQDDGEFFKFRVGQFFSGPTPLVLSGVESGETPAGRMARMVYRGPRSGLPTAYAQVDAFLQTRQIERRGDGLPWEVYAPTPQVLATTPLAANDAPAGGATPAPAPADEVIQVEIFIPVQ